MICRSSFLAKILMITWGMQLLASNYSGHDLPSYMEQSVFYNEDFKDLLTNTNILEIIGPENSNSIIPKKITGHDNFGISLLFLYQDQKYQISLEDFGPFILVLKKGKIVISYNNTRKILREFDTIFINKDVNLDLLSIKGYSELFLIKGLGLVDDENSLPTGIKIASFAQQKPVRELGVLNFLQKINFREAEKILDILGPKELFLIAGPNDHCNPRPNYAISLDIPFLLCIASVPPQNGPALHIHRLTTEIFVILRGEFLISFGDEGQYEILARSGDIVLFPPSINRTFKNIGDDMAMIMPIVIGAKNEFDDIYFLENIKKQLLESGICKGSINFAKFLGLLKIGSRKDIYFPYGDISGEEQI